MCNNIRHLSMRWEIIWFGVGLWIGSLIWTFFQDYIGACN